MQTHFQLDGHIALVTGGYRGLGRAIARGLAQAGARVVVSGRTADAVERSAAEMRAEGLDVQAVSFDVTDRESIDAGISRIEKEVGSVTVLVNNAGVIRRAPMLEMADKDWHEVIDTNLTGAFMVARRVVPAMIERRQGKIINICSALSILGRSTVAGYGAAKAGLKILTQTMTAEWARFNVQANGIVPGYYATDITKALVENAEFNAWLMSRTPAERWGNPEDLVGPAVFLASSASDFVNGHMLVVDGGLLATL